ncbi:MAG: hypothetical protein JWP97_5601 [Labilithrix sp.]|nr:hypothetical protein [Labilithrix sp.]
MDLASPPLDVLNRAFHAQYDAARVPQEAPPVLAVVGDELVVFHRGGRRAHTFVPHASHVLKSAAHAPVALFLTLLRLGTRSLAEARAKLEPLRARVAEARARAGDEGLEPEALADVERVLDVTGRFAERALSSLPDREEQETYAREVGPTLLALTSHATKLQLASLDRIVDEVLATFTSDERRRLQVVVTGDHQARARNLAMQYFGKRLREPEGEPERVTYAEAVSTAEEAFALVGTRQLDAVVATAFFGDAKRLQQDVLGDAVAAQLEHLDLGHRDD